MDGFTIGLDETHLTRTNAKVDLDHGGRNGPRWPRSLRARLLIAVNTVVALMMIGALILDYRRELTTELSAYPSALSDEARSLLPGVEELQHHGLDTVQRYLDAVCAAMQDESSPGHHIIVDCADVTIQAQSHLRASDVMLKRIREASASHGGPRRGDAISLIVGEASDGDIHAYVSKKSEPVIARIRNQATVRLLALIRGGINPGEGQSRLIPFVDSKGSLRECSTMESVLGENALCPHAYRRTIGPRFRDTCVGVRPPVSLLHTAAVMLEARTR